MLGMILPNLRQANTSDAEPVQALDALVVGNASRRDSLFRAIEDGNCTIAEEEGRVVGFVILDNSFFGQPFISLLMVRADERRRGIGNALMRHAERRCAGDRLFTSTNGSNVAMQRLCERRRFVRSGVIENLDEGDPEIVYFKSLGAGA